MQKADWRPRLESLLDDFRRRQADVARSGDRPDRIEVARAWHAELVDHQLAAPGWPREVGGLDLPLADQLDYYRMTTDAGAPPHPCPLAFIPAPTPHGPGTPGQKDRFLM